MLLIITLGEPRESWDCPRESRTYCHPTNNTQFGENPIGTESLGSLTAFTSEHEVYLLLDVV